MMFCKRKNRLEVPFSAENSEKITETIRFALKPGILTPKRLQKAYNSKISFFFKLLGVQRANLGVSETQKTKKYRLFP
jgi:hypothetical protein